MKKLLLVPIALFTQLSFAATEPSVDSIDATIIDNIIKFKEMEKGHKDYWLNSELNRATTKINLMIEHHDALVDFMVNKIKAFKNVKSFAELNGLLTSELDGIVNLHRSQREEWFKKCKAMNDADEKEFNKQTAKLKQFEEKAGLFKK